MRYRTTILATGGQTTGVPVPPEVLATLGGGKRPPVTVTIGTHTYRSSVASVGGQSMISLSAANRSAAGVEAGDEVEVDVERDDAPRVVALPPDLAAALDERPDARRTWDGLSYSQQRWHVLQVEGAKTDATRRKRIDSSVTKLAEGRPR
jgi:hypothetical protein